MQAIKDKLHDITAMRKVKAEAKAEEQAQRDLAKARMEVAHEVRKAKEAEAAMDLHVQRAAEKALEHEKKYPEHKKHHTSPTQSLNGYDLNDADFYSIEGQDGSITDTINISKR